MTKQELAKAMMDKGYATGHGDSVVDLLQELEWQVAERERKACAKVAESYEPTCDSCPSGAAIAIRARGIDGAKVGEVGIWGDKREWVGLTQEDKDDLVHALPEFYSIEHVILATEAKLKEKNT